MPPLPMIPNWDGLHPMIIHFPIVLFVLAPLFLLFAVFTRTDRRYTLLCSALIVMVLATTSLYVAFETETAGTLINRTAEIAAVVEHHQELADLSRNSFTVATALLGLVLLIRRLFHLHTPSSRSYCHSDSSRFMGSDFFGWSTLHTPVSGLSTNLA